ncbi:MAG: twitching motility protein PilT, partial [Deltaproteobacteria bacterium]
MDISELLIFMVDNKGSDLHVSAGEVPMVRIHGDMRKIEVPPLEKDDVHNMI